MRLLDCQETLEVARRDRRTSNEWHKEDADKGYRQETEAVANATHPRDIGHLIFAHILGTRPFDFEKSIKL